MSYSYLTNDFSDCTNSSEVEQKLKRALIKTHGKFRLAIVDKETIDEELRGAFNIHFTPSIFLFYRGNIAQEYRGNAGKEKLNEFVRAALFFHQMATEEQLVAQLLDESVKSLDEKRWMEAIHFLKEVESMEKWKDLYGGKIYANLGKFLVTVN